MFDQPQILFGGDENKMETWRPVFSLKNHESEINTYYTGANSTVMASSDGELFVITMCKFRFFLVRGHPAFDKLKESQEIWWNTNGAWHGYEDVPETEKARRFSLIEEALSLIRGTIADEGIMQYMHEYAFNMGVKEGKKRFAQKIGKELVKMAEA